MKELTKPEAVKSHREMWHWIADETLKRKRKVYKIDYFREMEIPFGEIPINECYCCEYNNQQFEKFGVDIDEAPCNFCPVDWEYDVYALMCLSDDEEGSFGKWVKETNYKEAAKLARMIAELNEI